MLFNDRCGTKTNHNRRQLDYSGRIIVIYHSTIMDSLIRPSDTAVSPVRVVVCRKSVDLGFYPFRCYCEVTDAKTKETRNRGRWDVNNGLGSCLSTTYGRVLQLLLVLSCRPYDWRLCLNSRDYVLRTMMYRSFRS